MCEVEFVLVLPAAPTAPAWVRRGLRRWLTEVGWPCDEADDLVLVASEAVSNSVEHGFRDATGVGESDAVRVHAVVDTHVDGGWVVWMTIADRGVWREPPLHREGRRRGLSLIRAVAAEVRLDLGPDGTTLTLRTRPCPRRTSSG